MDALDCAIIGGNLAEICTITVVLGESGSLAGAPGCDRKIPPSPYPPYFFLTPSPSAPKLRTAASWDESEFLCGRGVSRCLAGAGPAPEGWAATGCRAFGGRVAAPGSKLRAAGGQSVSRKAEMIEPLMFISRRTTPRDRMVS